MSITEDWVTTALGHLQIAQDQIRPINESIVKYGTKLDGEAVDQTLKLVDYNLQIVNSYLQLINLAHQVNIETPLQSYQQLKAEGLEQAHGTSLPTSSPVELAELRASLRRIRIEARRGDLTLKERLILTIREVNRILGDDA